MVNRGLFNKGLLAQFNIPARIQRNLVWGLLIAGALVAFEAFNFSTTEFSLRDLLVLLLEEKEELIRQLTKYVTS